MLKYFLSTMILLCLLGSIQAQANFEKDSISFTAEKELSKKGRLNAILLCVLTGPLGGHRLYLGTKPIVPIFYTLTLGGGLGLLPLIDLILLLIEKDPAYLLDNDRVFVWSKRKNTILQ